MEEIPTDLKAISAEEVSVSLLVEELPTDLKEISAEEVSDVLFWWRSCLQI